MIPSEEVTGVVLAGGRATRMGGQDKGLLQLADNTIAGRITDQLSTQVADILINANRNIEAYAKLGYKVVSDSLSNFQGPLAGMLTGLHHAKTDWVLTVPCDGPFIDQQYAKRMFEAVSQTSNLIAVATDGNRLQPVYALIHKSLAENLTQFLASGERKIDRWYQQHQFSEVAFPGDNQMFININTPEQLQLSEDSILKNSLCG